MIRHVTVPRYVKRRQPDTTQRISLQAQACIFPNLIQDAIDYETKYNVHVGVLRERITAAVLTVSCIQHCIVWVQLTHTHNKVGKKISSPVDIKTNVHVRCATREDEGATED